MRKILFLTFLLGGMLSATSCEDALQEEVFDFLSPTSLEDSESGADLLLQGAYTTINENLFRYDVWPRIGNFDSDYSTGPSWAFGSVGSGNFNRDTWMYEGTWGGLYKIIHRSNVGIETVEKMTFDERARKNTIGQFQFLKAWSYFYLVRMFGPVPIMPTSLGAGADPQQPRQDVKVVYDHIIELLKAAEGNLYTRNDPGFKVGRVSKGAASALLAKVYVTMASGSLEGAQVTVQGGPAKNADGTLKDSPSRLTFTKKVVAGLEGVNSAEYFRLARDKAKEVMDSGEFTLFPSYSEVWNITNRNRGEHIWMVQAVSGSQALGLGINTWYLGYLNADGEVANGRWVAMRHHWYELFEDDKDDRVVKGVQHRWKQWGNTHFYPAKHASKVEARDPKYGYTGEEVNLPNQAEFYYASLTKFGAVTDNTIDRTDYHFPLLRYADIVLVYAEAANEANGGPTAEAYAALNSIRTRSNASAAPAGMTQQQFRSYVIEERARELALEMNRKWDLMRWGIYLDVMNAIGVDENNVVKRREPRNLLFPVPVQEINTNKNFGPQNQGW
ncbi:RagB/SusD family nutrient uptake outer membrane protein [Telluribacter sp. SYSU D00476]|uniref:RagB/SusD family nutrient uptake outer membrane protein n=1 Tax=Telluribacter sp. SYSU D00476 TaxID=2811430 RepID=UPI001FF5A16F|nr:RagB/SusD family nutrient uptake outer membrane protein [Telluribacter sp. SYSU D00476]